MTARIIDGKAIAQAFRAEFAIRVGRLQERGIVPGLAVVIVGDDPASKVYVRNKALACESIGMHSEVHALPAEIPQARLVDFVQTLNENAAIHGILVQLPLPQAHREPRGDRGDRPGEGRRRIPLPQHRRALRGRAGFYPCTPWGIMKLLEHESIRPRAEHAVIVGRSAIVGKPMALMLLHADATVTICHSKTRDLPAVTREADILIAAVGKARMITATMVRPGAVVIDVGVNRGADGRLAGDVDFEAVAPIASHITPVPGGVGPMTIAMLIGNTVKAAERAAGSPPPWKRASPARKNPCLAL
jgi:methylenetetrahydrofolate dehydrogenase (NADP+)/methenyltetrahydrofolate cyclohydrolase